MTDEKYTPQTVRIKHGLFTYYEEEVGIKPDGTYGPRVVERIAFHGKEVTVPFEGDYRKGVETGAFYADDEPVAGANEPAADAIVSETGGNRTASDLDDDQLVEWIQGTGEFDGSAKPNADQVVQAAGGDAEQAQRLHDAEVRANGDSARKTVLGPLEAIVDNATQ
jgi:hypothetical protein